MSGELVTETGILVVLRGAIFFACRKYLLRSLYSDLQDLSGSGVDNSTSIPMRDPLPSPITQFERDKPNRKTESVYSTLASDIFAGCFSESCMLFLLLMLQGLSVFSSSTRLFNWKLSMFLLLTCILVLVPFLFSLLLTVGSDSGPRTRSVLPRLIFSTLCVAIYIFAISCIPLPIALSASDRMTATLSRLVVLGTIILGLLAGFGAVSSSWAFIPSQKTVVVPAEQDIVSAEYSLSSIRDDLGRRRAEASRRAAAQQTDDLQEIKGLEALEYQMSRSLEDLRARRAAAKFSRTFRGRLVNVGGRLFALYCLFRFVTCIVNIFVYPDIVTAVVAELLRKVSPDIQFDDVARATRHTSLVLVGVIILSSVRLVLRGVTRALRVTSRNLGASLMLLLLAQLMSSSARPSPRPTALPLHGHPPHPPPAPVPSSDGSPSPPDPNMSTTTTTVNLLSTIPDFQVFGRLFDWSFLLSASGSLVVRWAAGKVNGPSREY
ncbi:G protein-coupled receptor 89 [Mycena venus]|uniref:G protein-coupled receptor 89 n=1 Tax=Mycena venus TaxID=2733690 RepID=A0A8H7DCV7_9AGAR|nr:G protein-coupled receptor 89 [Mycena venus]